MGGRLSVKTENLISGGTKLTLTARELSDISRQVMEISRDSAQTMIYAGEKISFAQALRQLNEAERGARSLGTAAVTISHLYQNNELSVISVLGKAMSLAAKNAGAAASAAGSAVGGLAGNLENGVMAGAKAAGQVVGKAGSTGKSVERVVDGAEETLERIRYKFGNMTVPQLLTYFFGSHYGRFDGGSLPINAFSGDDSDEELAESTLENLIDI